MAGFLARSLGGPFDPETAAALAEAVPAERIPEGEAVFTAVDHTTSGLRTLASVALPGATRPPPARGRRATHRAGPGRPAQPAEP